MPERGVVEPKMALQVSAAASCAFHNCAPSAAREEGTVCRHASMDVFCPLFSLSNCARKHWMPSIVLTCFASMWGGAAPICKQLCRNGEVAGLNGCYCQQWVYRAMGSG